MGISRCVARDLCLRECPIFEGNFANDRALISGYFGNRLSNAPGITKKRNFVRVEMQSICIYSGVTVPSTRRLSAAP